MKRLLGLVRRQRAITHRQSHVARWIGRNWARVSYALKIEPTWLELNTIDIPVADLPTAFHNFRIVHLSDFHSSRYVNAAYLSEAVAMAQAQQGDVIVLTGDFVHKGYRYIAQVTKALSQLSAPYGVWAVLGNHDYSVRNALGIRRHPQLYRAITNALLHIGIRVLHNEAVVVERSNEKLYLIGLADLWSRAFEPEKALNGTCLRTPRIILAHNPCSIEHLHGQRCDLMLSGHTHGGQVNLPKFGRVVLSKRGRRYAAGLYEHPSGFLYVNKGVGFGLPVRYNARPEVAVLTLRPKENGQPDDGQT